jgi:predicted nucleic-acid-binding Zn-ribbon protein
MARQVSTTVCSNCLEDFPSKELYTVSRKSHRGIETNHDEYYAPYCKKCLKDKPSYIKIISEPKILKQKK